mmetsp:Transcript_33116/g.72213  ORF Transcript_33116/g.72213 Transcript_33116/m.72213 type:complete len:221 (-) Transcript_33116:53-715(-)
MPKRPRSSWNSSTGTSRASCTTTAARCPTRTAFGFRSTSPVANVVASEILTISQSTVTASTCMTALKPAVSNGRSEGRSSTSRDAWNLLATGRGCAVSTRTEPQGSSSGSLIPVKRNVTASPRPAETTDLPATMMDCTLQDAFLGARRHSAPGARRPHSTRPSAKTRPPCPCSRRASSKSTRMGAAGRAATALALPTELPKSSRSEPRWCHGALLPGKSP